MTVSQRRAIELGIVGIAVIIGVLFVDRPVALWSQASLYQTPLFDASMALLRMAKPLGIASVAVFGIAALWRLSGKSPVWVGRLLAGFCSALLALALTEILKYGLGRSQVYPLFLLERVYAFHPLSGSQNYAAFPSATMSAAAGLLSGPRFNRPYARAAVALVLLVLVVALVATNSHWLSDIIAGTWLGLAAGRAVSQRWPEPAR